MPHWLDPQRLASLVVAAGYVVLAYVMEDGKSACLAAMFLVLPLACIWFSQAMGDYTGWAGARRPITSRTPAGFVAFGGWLLLALPVVIALA